VVTAPEMEVRSVWMADWVVPKEPGMVTSPIKP